MKYAPKIEKEMMCPIEYGLDIFGGKWKSRILCVLSATSAMRYNAIRRELGNITDAVLAAMLKELVSDSNRLLLYCTHNSHTPTATEVSCMSAKPMFLSA